ncbi:MAG: hypothetical protein AAFR61_02405 [Bacteroidota bacterium]
MKIHQTLFLCLLIGFCGLSCQSLNPGQSEVIPQISFLYEDGVNMPQFVSLSDQESGEVIEAFQPVADQTYTIEVPRKFRSTAYDVTYFNDTRNTFFGKAAEAFTYRDFRQDMLVRRVPPPNDYSYKPFILRADSPIESFWNGKNGIFYNKIHTNSLTAEIELTVQDQTGPAHLVVVKLQNEEFMRYRFFPNPLEETELNIQIDTLPQVPAMKEILLDEGIQSARVKCYLDIDGQKISNVVLDTYRSEQPQDDRILMPDFTSLYSIISVVDYYLDGGLYGQYIVEGLPDKIVAPNLSIDVVNNRLTQATLNITHADLAGHTFEAEEYRWHVLEEQLSGREWVRPEVPQAVRDSLPVWSQPATLTRSNLIQYLPGHDMTYQQMAFGEWVMFSEFWQVVLRNFPGPTYTEKIRLASRNILQD